ncbi:MAG TPA: O-antigen ligase family protein [Pyrinomonadaceae bacterium]|nr:O-antigen ligase family protein [Pyrinomonadaceae bacterium]
MQQGSQSFSDYEPVAPAPRRRTPPREEDEWPAPDAGGAVATPDAESLEGSRSKKSVAKKSSAKTLAAKDHAFEPLRRGHSLTFVCLFAFTILLYLRPSELYPSVVTNNITFVVGLITLAVFLASQLSAEGTLTARPREVNAVLLLCVAALLSMPLAASPALAWEEFSGTFIRCVVIFVVIVNAVRTERRLRALLLLAVFVSLWLSAGAFNDYRLGNLTVEGYRVGGHGSGIFGNSNDLALHLVTIIPVAAGLLFASRGLARKAFYAASILLMTAAIVVTYSRGGFLGLVCAFAVLGWKMGRRHRLAVFGAGAVLGVGFLAFAPGNYGVRLLSILIPSLDPVGSYGAREGELVRSFWAAVHSPFFGVGMGNYVLMSFDSRVTHNAYTQVAAELGTPALVCYLFFVVTPLRRMGRVWRETLSRPDEKRFNYLAAGLQASLAGYMVSSFFASVAYLWYVYYLVGYAVCLERIYASERAAQETETKTLASSEETEAKTQAGLEEASEVEPDGAAPFDGEMVFDPREI